MNKTILTVLGSVAAAAAFATPAQALTIDLNLTTSNGFAGPTYSQDGFTLTNSNGSNTSYGNWLTLGQSSYNANGSNATLFVNYGSTTNTLTKTGGGTFSFQGISLADVYNAGSGGTVSFAFNYAGGGSSNQVVTLNTVTGLQAFTFNQTNLSSVVFTALTTPGPYLQFDFLRVDGATTVPEPATWGMMILGFGVVGGALRRRSAVKTNVRYA